MKFPGNVEAGYRYAYQGQEKDGETGKEAFELSLWDSRIGRWLAPDPYGQYASPYLGIGNDPINGVDLDGGYRSRVSAYVAWALGLFKGHVEKYSSQPIGGYRRFGINLTGADEANGNILIDYGKKVPVLTSGFSLQGTGATIEDLPDVYMEANVAAVQGKVKGSVSLLGTNVGIGVDLPVNDSVYDLGLKMHSSLEENAFSWNEPINGYPGNTFGGEAAYGLGANLKFTNSGRLQEVTCSALVTKLTNEYHISGIHSGKISRSKLGINVGATASFFVGLEANFKMGVIVPSTNSQ